VAVAALSHETNFPVVDAGLEEGENLQQKTLM
jgi:hypothetical protein